MSAETRCTGRIPDYICEFAFHIRARCGLTGCNSHSTNTNAPCTCRAAPTDRRGPGPLSPGGMGAHGSTALCDGGVCSNCCKTRPTGLSIVQQNEKVTGACARSRYWQKL